MILCCKNTEKNISEILLFNKMFYWLKNNKKFKLK